MNDEWTRWFEAQDKATEAWGNGDLKGAIEVIGRYLQGEPPLELRRKAIAFRGDLREEQGDREAASTDFQLAHGLSEEPDYERYTLELSLGNLAHAAGQLGAADSWYVQALRTASEDSTTSGGLALFRLLRLRGKQGLAEEERKVSAKVVRQAWALLRIEGEPDLDSLEEMALTLIRTQSQRPTP